MVALAFYSTGGPRSTAARLARMGWIRALGRLGSRLTVEWRLRQEIRAVAGLDDAMLRDIGLARGGVEHAVRCGRRSGRAASVE